ncbi:hypothetical protein K438DRAFT_1925023 [Mycena galopus ATCC 62051]|nr:hypothetical protein K438DRAFT_1925023 [Mycena galopus ATCC 62051]
MRTPRSINASFGTLEGTAYGSHCWSEFANGFRTPQLGGLPYSQRNSACWTSGKYSGSSGRLSMAAASLPAVVWARLKAFPSMVDIEPQADFRYNESFLVEASLRMAHLSSLFPSSKLTTSPMFRESMHLSSYRLAILSSKALANEGSLNLGLCDEQLSLHWVQENITQFSGNPECVNSNWLSLGSPDKNQFVVSAQESDNLRAKAGSTSIHTQIIAESGNGGTYSSPDAAPFQATYDALIANTLCASTANSTERFKHTSKWHSNKYRLEVPQMRGAPLAANTTTEVRANLVGSVPPQFIDGMLDVYPDVPSSGCPFNTSDFQLNPFQNRFFSTPGLQNKRVVIWSFILLARIYMNFA